MEGWLEDLAPSLTDGRLDGALGTVDYPSIRVFGEGTKKKSLLRVTMLASPELFPS